MHTEYLNTLLHTCTFLSMCILTAPSTEEPDKGARLTKSYNSREYVKNFFELISEYEIGDESDSDKMLSHLSTANSNYEVMIIDLSTGDIVLKNIAKVISDKEYNMVGVALIFSAEEITCFWRLVSYPHMPARVVQIPKLEKAIYEYYSQD